MRDFQGLPWCVVCELHHDKHQFQRKLRRIHEDPSRFLGNDGGVILWDHMISVVTET